MAQSGSASELGKVIFSMLHQENQLGSVVVYVIIAFFVVAMLDIVRTLARVAPERNWLLRARAKFATYDSKEPLPAVRDELLKALDLGTAPDSCLVKRQIGELLRIVPLRGFDASLIRNLAGNQFELGGGFARFAAGTLTVIGLVGTVLGLSIAVGNLPKLGVGQDITAFTNQMQNILGGMGTAFSCTLAGLFGAVVLSVANWGLRAFQARFIQELDAFVYLELAPVLLPRHEDHSASQFVDRFETAGEKLEDALKAALGAAASLQSGAQALTAALSELKELSKLPKAIENLPVDLAAALRAVSGDLKDAVKSGVAEAMVEHRASTRLENEETKKEFALLLVGVQDAVTEMLQNVNGPIEALTRRDEELHQHLRMLAGQNGKSKGSPRGGKRGNGGGANFDDGRGLSLNQPGGAPAGGEQ